MYNPATSSTSSPPTSGRPQSFRDSGSTLNTWWQGSGGFTRRQGDALLFTGLMYQAIPYIEATTRYLERLEGTRWRTTCASGASAAMSRASWWAGASTF